MLPDYFYDTVLEGMEGALVRVVELLDAVLPVYSIPVVIALAISLGLTGRLMGWVWRKIT